MCGITLSAYKSAYNNNNKYYDVLIAIGHRFSKAVYTVGLLFQVVALCIHEDSHNLISLQIGICLTCSKLCSRNGSNRHVAHAGLLNQHLKGGTRFG